MKNDDSISKRYFNIRKKKLFTGLLLLTAIAAAAAASLASGSSGCSAGDALRALLSGDDKSATGYILWNLRLPRTLIAVFCGAALGASGAVTQTVLKNPLATPFTIGISQGAAFGASFAIIFLKDYNAAAVKGSAPYASLYSVALCAFAGALVSTGFILLLSGVRNVGPLGLILAGVALNSLFGALTMLTQYFATDVQLASALFWTFGDLGRAGYTELWVIIIVFTAAAVYFVLKSWEYNAMEWGDETAAGLGVRVRRLRTVTMLLASVASAAVTAFIGVIGFIGLIAPHTVRVVTGGDHRYLIVYSALFGSLLLLASDLIARTVMAPQVLPVGIITSFAGAPLFLYLLIRGGRDI